jgi:hypothetical protein
MDYLSLELVSSTNNWISTFLFHFILYCHCVVCPSIYGFWLPLWCLRYTDSDYPFGILDIRILITPLVSSNFSYIQHLIPTNWWPIYSGFSRRPLISWCLRLINIKSVRSIRYDICLQCNAILAISQLITSFSL